MSSGLYVQVDPQAMSSAIAPGPGPAPVPPTSPTVFEATQYDGTNNNEAIRVAGLVRGGVTLEDGFGNPVLGHVSGEDASGVAYDINVGDWVVAPVGGGPTSIVKAAVFPTKFTAAPQ